MVTAVAAFGLLPDRQPRISPCNPAFTGGKMGNGGKATGNPGEFEVGSKSYSSTLALLF